MKCQSSKQKVHNVKETQESDSEAEFVMTIAQDKRMHSDTVAAQMEIVHSGKRVKFQINTRATINAIPRYLIPNVKRQESNTKLKSWCSTELKVKGSCRLILRNPKNRRKYSVEFFVVDGHVTPVLGKRACERMGLVNVNYGHIQTVFESDILTEFKDVFNNEIGTLPGDVHLTIHSQTSPVAIPSCIVPVSIRKNVDKKLRQMELQGVITKVQQPTEWVSRMAANVKKDGDLRICIDPLHLNKALKHELHPLPVIDDVLTEISGASVFSKFDLAVVTGTAHFMKNPVY